jgi:molybdenum cofactor cytidylyltransferase
MIAGLVLAAGESTRMGQDKALLPYRGRTFLETIVSTLDEGGIERIVVVLGHHAEEIRRVAEMGGAEVVVNPHYQLGQTSSLQAGLAPLQQPEIEGVLVCLVDHPAVSAETVRAMVGAFQPPFPSVIIPTFRGQRGHPVLVSRQLFRELLGLAAGDGANTVIRKYLASGRLLEVNDAGVVTDIDDAETYHRLEGR